MATAGKVVRYRRAIVHFFFAVLCVFGLSAAFAQTVPDSSGTPFNHTGTGFPLSGAHVTARCESCHLQGVFRGTPRDCATCHRMGGRVISAERMPATHIPTSANQDCDTCHRTNSWSPAMFTHQGVMTGRCDTCHNNINAPGKPATHTPTTSSCDSCHKLTAWTPAGYDHASVAPGTCATCHNGSKATGKPANHIPTAASCDTCHPKPPASMSFAQARMNHTGMAGQCSTCHSGSYLAWNAQTKPSTHIVTTAQCDSCHHSTTTWATASFDHAAAAPAVTGRCSSCHNGTTAIGKPTNHISTTTQCDACHTNFTAFAPAAMNHAATAGPAASGNCSTCHNGTKVFANALGKPASHIPTTSQCDSCHNNYVAFAPATMNHAGMTGKCSTCHNGSYLSANAQTKPATHVATSAQCDTCHKSTTSWATASYVHDASAAGKCSTCHNSVNAIGKPTNHIPTSRQCDTCHNNFFAFAPAAMNHVGTAGQCTTCHSGAYVAVNALTKPVTHIPNPSAAVSQCDTCHTSGFTAWSPANMNHTGMAGYCDRCHNGSYLAVNAQSKPPTHIATSAQCDSCHKSTVSWATATFDHSTASPAVTGRCSSCHNGTTALGKSTNHIPTTAQCDTCHVGGFAAFAPATMNHAATTGPSATGNCSTCHGGAYNAQNALSKPATHLPTTQQCDTCHTTAAWMPTSFSHAGVAAGTCSTCHNGTTATGKPATGHIPTTAQCDTCHKNFTAFAPAVMSHSGTTGPVAAGNCSTCHGGAYLAVNAQTKPPTHVTTTAQCDSCHSSTTSWATASFNHAAASPPVTGRCATCHNGTAALGKPTNHIPTGAQCDVCHTSTSYVSFVGTGQMNHAATVAPAAAGNCSTCHNGGYTSSNALAKPPTHIPTALQCDSCHKNYSAFAPATMNHSGTGGQCATCHSGSYVAVNAQTKPATHVPTTKSCDTCHASTTTWLPATFSHTGVAAGTCTTCHNGINASGKSTPHIPTTQSCDACHRTGIAWLPLLTPYAHTGIAAGTCSTCHGGSYPNIDTKTSMIANHVPTTASCDACHRTTAWVPNIAYAHTGIASGTCASCHGNSVNYAGLTKPPANHFPDAVMSMAGLPGPECSNCHSSTTSFAVERMNHGTMQTGCATCHASTSTYLVGTADKITLGRHKGSNASDDCSKSGCHRPLGSKGTPYTKWN